MIRKMAILAAVALVPSFAFAAGTVTNNAASETHVTGATSTDAAASSAKTDVKSDAGAKTTKRVRHSAVNKAKAKVDTKADAKESSPKL